MGFGEREREKAAVYVWEREINISLTSVLS